MPQRTKGFQRRLVTIISADVAGFSRLMSDNEEDTLSTWRLYVSLTQQIVQRHNGRIFGLAGDSFMIEFERPFDAVQCAITLQGQLACENAQKPEHCRMQFRLGINIGDVLVEEDRLFGDDINIAARLQERAEPGGIVVADVVKSHVAGRLSIEFEDLGNLTLYNIRHPVRAYRARASVAAERSGDEGRSRAALIDLSKPVAGFGGRPALAVLPFYCIGCNSALEYAGDSLADELIDGLARLRWFPVIDRNSSLAFRQEEFDSRYIGQSLGARYLVSGRIHIDGDNARVSAELKDADDDKLIWRDSFDRSVGNFLAVQSDIVRSIISTLDYKIDQSEQRRALGRQVADLSAGELVRRGSYYQRRLRRDDAEQARRYFILALDRDPNNIEALIQLSWWYFWHNWTQRGPREELAEVTRLANRAVELDPEDARGHMLVGIGRLMSGQPANSTAPLTEAIRLNPSLSVARAVLGSAHILLGEPEQGIAFLRTAVRLNPHDLYLFHLLGELAVAHYMLGEWDEALGWAASSLHLRPGYWYPRVITIGVYARTGQLEQAQEALQELDLRCPGFSLNYIRWLPFSDTKWHGYLIDGLQLAGFRSCNAAERSSHAAPIHPTVAI